MNCVNYYQKKYEALDAFYGWIDRGSDYKIAVEQTEYYEHKTDIIDVAIMNITIAATFFRNGKAISPTFRESLRNMLPEAKKMNLKEYGLTDEEIIDFYTELKEVETLIM